MPCGDLREQGLEVRGSPACAGTKEVGGGAGRGEAAGQRRWAAWPGPSLQQEGGGPEDGPGAQGGAEQPWPAWQTSPYSRMA